MKKSGVVSENVLRAEEIKKGAGDPYEDINGKSSRDGIDRSELAVRDRKDTIIDQDFVKDMDGDEDFYGDDEENQSGATSYTGNEGKYLGQGNWADKEFGEGQFNHEGDVEYFKTMEKK